MAPCLPAAAIESLQTERDKALRETLHEANSENASILRASDSARMSRLRNRYKELLAKSDFAAQLSVTTVGSVNNSKKKAAAAESRLEGVFQFQSNWQTSFSWSVAQNLTADPAPIRQTAGELPSLEVLTLSYGKERSVETRLGLLSDTTLLQSDSLNPLFSGIAVLVHPVSQKMNPFGLLINADFEHGWNTFRNSANSEGFSSIQRTRPRFTVSYANSPFIFRSSLSLEWYSDTDAVFGSVLANRQTVQPDALKLYRLPETRWRLFGFSGSTRIDDGSNPSLSLSFERVTNSIGSSSRPAWSAESVVQKNFVMGSSSFGLRAGVLRFSTPAVAVPPARLPPLLNAGTQGTSARAEMIWSPDINITEEYVLQAGHHAESLLGQAGALHCSSTRGPPASNVTQICRTLWLTLAWTLKLPTKL
jgi:hypothetical protein